MKSFDALEKDLKTINAYLRESLDGKPVPLKSAADLHGLAAGLKHGILEVEGDVGDYFGVLNDGASLHVHGNAGKYLADNMTAGEVVVDGNADFGTAQYGYGGTIVVHGNAGDFTATMNKGATVIICGNVGDEVGTYMLKGDLVVLGDAGQNFANYLIRGNIFIRGQWASLGHNTRQEALTPDDIARLQALFTRYAIPADPAGLKKLVAASEKPFYH